ncbi:MAG: TonB-dependent receptor plug domain-containing protein, partial [Pseudomonadota bacterium]
MSGAKLGRVPLKSVMLVSAAALAVGAAAAQDASEEELREETVTVYGTSNPLPVFDYPGQVTVVDRDAIETLAPSTISDALRDVPGLDFAGGPRRTGEAPSLRGLSGQNVLILLDGARQSFTSAHDGRFFVDPELIGTAEVVRGPASALYGSGAVGGVLAFESVDADDLLADDETWGARFRL